MTAFNASQFRAQFPALAHVGTYLDSAATMLKPQVLIDATHDYYTYGGANVHRSQHSAALKSTEAFEMARDDVAQLLNAPSRHDIVWTKGCTESINLVAQSYARPRLTPGDEIIISQSEHHANLVPWLMVAQQTGAKIVTLPLDDNYCADLDILSTLLNERSKILALGQMSNITGAQPDLAKAIRLAHQYECVVMVDGAQGIVHNEVDVTALDVDFYSFSAHKLYGPNGVGVLYGKSELLAKMAPWHGGGKMLTDVSHQGFTAHSVPYCFEAGTPNIAGIIGFGAVLTWLKQQNRQQAEAYAQHLADIAIEQLSAISGFEAKRSGHASLFSFNIKGIHAADMAMLLSEQNIAIRAGKHCAQPLMMALGEDSTLRASFAPYNNEDDVAAFVNAVNYAAEILAE